MRFFIHLLNLCRLKWVTVEGATDVWNDHGDEVRMERRFDEEGISWGGQY